MGVKHFIRVLTELVKADPTWVEDLKEILALEGTPQGMIQLSNEPHIGWRDSDVKVARKRVKQLFREGILSTTYESNRDHVYHITYPDVLKEFLSNYRDSVVVSTECIWDDIKVTQEDRDLYNEVIRMEEPWVYLSDFIAPNIKGRVREKVGVLLQLLSLEDSHGDRNRINVLFYGKPGTGKSEIASWVCDVMGAVYVDGSRVSKPDLTVNKLTKQPGALVKAHKWICVIEEADEMDKETWGACLQAMGEAGIIEVAGEKYPAEVMSLVTTNSIKGWKAEVLNRFSIIFPFEIESWEALKGALDYRYKYYGMPKPNDRPDFIRAFIKLAREYIPEIVEREEIMAFKNRYIHSIGGVRQGLDLMRVSLAMARMCRKPLGLEVFKTVCKFYFDKER